jgi:hypothetical protein
MKISPKEYKRSIRRALRHLKPTTKHIRIMDEKGIDWRTDKYNGQCYHATQAALHLFGWKEGYIAARDLEDGLLSHYWLFHPETGEHLDITGKMSGRTLAKGKDFNFARYPRKSGALKPVTKKIIRLVNNYINDCQTK